VNDKKFDALVDANTSSSYTIIIFFIPPSTQSFHSYPCLPPTLYSYWLPVSLPAPCISPYSLYLSLLPVSPAEIQQAQVP
jgi:hypothetical protein